MSETNTVLGNESQDLVSATDDTYLQGIEDALRIAIPIATCSCADRIVDALRRQRANVLRTANATERETETTTDS